MEGEECSACVVERVIAEPHDYIGQRTPHQSGGEREHRHCSANQTQQNQTYKNKHLLKLIKDFISNVTSLKLYISTTVEAA